MTKSNASKCATIEWPEGLNCYSFAARCRNPAGPKGKGCTSCVPGAKAGEPVSMTPLAPKGLVDACIADGFEYTGWGGGPQPACPDSHYLVAVFIDQKKAGDSYHFARQDESRQWVHKPSAAQPAVNFQGNYLLGDNLATNIQWGTLKLITYLRAPWGGVAVASAQGSFNG